jgi:hypothetical protein
VFPQGEVNFVSPDTHKYNYTGVHWKASFKKPYTLCVSGTHHWHGVFRTLENVLSRVLVTNNADSGLYVLVYLLLIHSTSNYT